MTQAFLQSELTSLISDSKRRFNDVRTAAEQSLTELKAISVTSETQLAGDLLRRAYFIDPFVLACTTKNVKLTITGTVCLQRLTASKAVARERLPDVLKAFHEGVAAGYEPQLKILQTLPSLLQLYAGDLHGDLLARTLEICAALQSSKNAIVSNTAAATFQQLIFTVFEEVEKHPTARLSNDGPSSESELDDKHQKASPEDAIGLFNDFCLLLDQQRPQVLNVESLPSAFLLETLQTIISTHGSFLASHIDQLQSSWEHLIHGLSLILVKRDSFGQVARALSIIFSIAQNYEESLRAQLSQLIPLLLNALEKDGNPLWKRALFLEFFRSLCSDFGVMRNTFELFDKDKESGKLIGQLMSALVRIAAEDPSLIGLGRQSTIPVQRTNELKSEEAASIEAQGLGGAITSVSSGDSSTTGISMEWSVLSMPLMDQPEKHAPPSIPSTYIYTLVLGCIASLCDGLSKFVMPLSVPSRPTQRTSLDHARKDSSSTEPAEDEGPRKSVRAASSTQRNHRLMNPLTLTNHPQWPEIQTCAAMVEVCWPAALATCSTFLNSALDAEFYHILIRSVQKLAQVSGVLELSTPRDALLTTLAKASTPNNANTILSNYQTLRIGRTGNTEHVSVHDVVKSPTEAPPTPTSHMTASTLNVRHLLCLRALLNLGIALGPTLEQDAWFILIETMQTVEALIAMPSTTATISQVNSPRNAAPGNENHTTLASEIAAVQAAAKRMLESTRTYSDESFSVTVRALFRLLGDLDLPDNSSPINESASPPISPSKTAPGRPPMNTSRSVSGLWTKSKTLDLEFVFVLNKVSEISRINIDRFAYSSEQSCSWDLIGARLLRLSQDIALPGNIRIQSASILDLIAMETMKLLDDLRFETKEADAVKLRCLNSLLKQLESLEQCRPDNTNSIDLEIHKRLLEALESMLSHSGDSLNSGWPTALKILSMSFLQRGLGQTNLDNASIDQPESAEDNAQVLRVAFRSIQLIASDFLGVLTDMSLASLSQLLRQFGSQSYDLNVALTSTTLLWGIASQVLTRIETIELTTMPPLNFEPKDFEAMSGTAAAATLWGVTLLQLVELGKDERADVRNAAIRVFLKMLEASSESLNAEAWAATLDTGPLSAIRSCIDQYLETDADQSEWLASAAQLSDGIVHLVAQNLAVIAEDSDFKNTWFRLLEVLKDLLGMTSLSASALAFSNLSRLLAALRTLRSIDPDLVMPALQLWAQYHPAQIKQTGQTRGTVVEGIPSQPAFTAHLHTFVEAHQTSNEAVTGFKSADCHIAALVMDSIESAVLLCTHPPYTSDVKTLAPEQKEACEALNILKVLLVDDVAQYSRYLLRLLNLSLGIQAGKVGVQQKRPAMTKSVQKPTFIAFAATCLDDLRALVVEYANDDMFIRTAVVQESFDTLSALISTKYTELPTNAQAPLWRNATVTAVAMLEALRNHMKQKQRSNDLAHLGHLSNSIISVADSLLRSGGLPNPPLKQSTETLLEDENFDIEHFQLFHRAVVPVFRHDHIDEGACEKYAMTLFNVSLLSKPWYYDMPDDLTHAPLTGLMEERPGSLHRPIFAVRRRICYAATDALFDLVQRASASASAADEHQDSSGPGFHKWARSACSYLLLRVIHPLKTFLADQPLRGLTPPAMPQQVELQYVLAKFVSLRSDDEALKTLADSMQMQMQNQNQNHLGGHAKSVPRKLEGIGSAGDGKEHLRLLYSFMLRVQRFWRELPRLKGDGAWQADEPGSGIEEALEQWSVTIGDPWRIG